MPDKFPANFYHDHNPKAIHDRLKQDGNSYLRDFVYGAVDGIITTFAVVAGVIGAQLQTSTILILGIANLVADGFSMAVGNYLGTKSEHDEKKLVERFEDNQIVKNPSGEKEEVRQILINQGFAPPLLEDVLKHITADRQRWVKYMVAEEYGLANTLRSPTRAAAMTFVAFGVFGLIPLLPFLFGVQRGFLWASISTGFAFFVVGSLKSRWTSEHPMRAGFITLAVGASAAGLAFSIGKLLKNLG